MTFRDHVEAVVARDRDAGPRRLVPRAGRRATPTRCCTRAAATVAAHDSVHGALSPRDAAALAAAARAHGVTLSTARARARWGLLLGRLLGRDRVVFGSTVSGRGGDLPGVETVVGLLINTRAGADGAGAPASRSATCSPACRTSRPTCSTRSSSASPSCTAWPGSAELFDSMVVVENFPAVRPARRAALTVRGLHRHRLRRTTRCRWSPSPATS